MKWSKTKPDRVGYYWCKSTVYQKPIVRVVFVDTMKGEENAGLFAFVLASDEYWPVNLDEDENRKFDIWWSERIEEPE